MVFWWPAHLTGVFCGCDLCVFEFTAYSGGVWTKCLSLVGKCASTDVQYWWEASTAAPFGPRVVFFITLWNNVISLRSHWVHVKLLQSWTRGVEIVLTNTQGHTHGCTHYLSAVWERYSTQVRQPKSCQWPDPNQSPCCFAQDRLSISIIILKNLLKTRVNGFCFYHQLSQGCCDLFWKYDSKKSAH